MEEKYKIGCDDCGVRVLLFVENEELPKIFCPQCQSFITAEKAPTQQSSFVDKKELQEINEYKFERKLKEGGMGALYLAKHKETEKLYAIKLLKVDGNEHFFDRFAREAYILQQLQHPNIVSYINCGNYKNKPYLVMEYIQGRDLHSAIAAKKLKVTECIKIIYNAASALEYCHSLQNPLIHRDIKPANIMLPEKDKTNPKVIDFGLGKIIGDHSLTSSGMIMGTFFYMPKEQLIDCKRVDALCDIYALGATFYHMLSGSPPYSEFSSNKSIVNAIMKSKLVPLDKKCPQLPKNLCDIVSKSMASEKQDRYQNATELKKAIKLFLKSLKT